MRLDPDKWGRFGMSALRRGTNRTELLNQFMDWYLRIPGAELPERPSAEILAEVATMELDEITEILRRPRRRPEGAE